MTGYNQLRDHAYNSNLNALRAKLTGDDDKDLQQLRVLLNNPGRADDEGHAAGTLIEEIEHRQTSSATKSAAFNARVSAIASAASAIIALIVVVSDKLF